MRGATFRPSGAYIFNVALKLRGIFTIIILFSSNIFYQNFVEFCRSDPLLKFAGDAYEAHARDEYDY